jgi:hypothetical protein
MKKLKPFWQLVDRSKKYKEYLVISYPTQRMVHQELIDQSHSKKALAVPIFFAGHTKD